MKGIPYTTTHYGESAYNHTAHIFMDEFIYMCEGAAASWLVCGGLGLAFRNWNRATGV